MYKMFGSIKRNCFFLILISLLFVGCSKKSYDFTRFPAQGVWRGELKDGQVLYMVRDTSIQEFSGDCFFYHEQAIADPYHYGISRTGNVDFDWKDSQTEGKADFDEHTYNIVLTLKKIDHFDVDKQRIELKFVYAIESFPACKERYKENIFSEIESKKSIKYGEAEAYYTAKPIEYTGNSDYNTIFKSVFQEFSNSVVKKGLTNHPLYMDLYFPKGDTLKKRPLLVYVHGGAFLFGDKENNLQKTITGDLVKKGFVVASVNYRLGSTLLGFNAIEQSIYRGVQDVRAALRYIVHHSQHYNIDPDHIYLAGSSAGGIISLTTTFMTDENSFDCANPRFLQKGLGKLDESGNKLKNSFKISGLISLWGAMTDLSLLKDSKPVPVLLFHGTDDKIVPYDYGLPFKDAMGNIIHNFISSSWGLYGSKSLYEKMLSYNFPVRYIEFKGFGHEPQVASSGGYNENMDIIMKEIDDFLYKNVSKEFSKYGITGKRKFQPTDKASVYLLSSYKNEKLHWAVQGGIIVDQKDGYIQVVWLNNSSPRKISVCIQNSIGVTVKKELLIR